MRKPLVASLSALIIFIIVVPTLVASASGSRSPDQTESIVPLLKQLCGNVSALPDEAFEDMKHADNGKNTMCNKINAVINQIEAGAYNGPLNKLRNDLEKVVEKWIASPWKGYLHELIEHIIRCIKCCCPPSRDLTPPVIHGVFHYPEAPEYEDYVTVLAYVTDCKSGVANVTLSYFTDLGKSVNLTMNKVDGLYEAEISPESYNVTVNFFVYAWDYAGNVAVSSMYSYIVGDFHPPVITYIEQVPAEPNYNETVLVFVNATEPLNASGVREIVLTYNNGSDWANVTMNLEDGLYVAAIPELPYGTLVQYRVYAFDNAGNWAAMDVYSYTVQDRFLPVARIDAPTWGSYLSGDINVEVYVSDDNFVGADLTVNGTDLASWTEAGSHAYLWDTTVLPDGIYVLKLGASDKAGNMVETECPVTVDNTAPVVHIISPLDGSYVRGTVFVEVSADDANLDEMKLVIGETVQVWEVGGGRIYVWNTMDFDDGVYTLVLSAVDRAGNEADTSVSVTVDNTAPSISNLVWTPSEPSANEPVNVSAQVFEEGSGVKNVTLWFSVDDSEWESLDMTLQDGNWACVIPGQAENATVTFYIECYDDAGNFAATLERAYTVKAAGNGGGGAVSGFPLGWLLLIIALIGSGIGGTIYYYRYRKRRV